MSFDPGIGTSESGSTSDGSYDSGTYGDTGSYEGRENGQQLDPQSEAILYSYIDRHTTPLKEAVEDYKLDREVSRLAPSSPTSRRTSTPS